MPIESRSEQLHWTSLEGTLLGDTYVLERFASADENTASFDTRTGGEKSTKALARVAKAEGEAAEQQLQVWQAIKMSGHPHLLAVWGAGRSRAQGQELIYVVVEAPDENLANVLLDRALNPAETGEILLSMVWALSHLHSHGFVHGTISPEQIVAVGETVKLSSGGVHKIGATLVPEIHKPRYKAPESVDGNVTPAADIWCLGATLVEALTQQFCGDNYTELCTRLPAPFKAVAEKCLQRDPEARGTLADLLTLYEVKEEEAAEVVRDIPKARAAAAAVGGGHPVSTDRPETSSDPEPTVPVYLAPGPVIPQAEAFSAEAFSGTTEAPTQKAQGTGSAAMGSSKAETSQGRSAQWRDTTATRPEQNAPAVQDVRRAKQRAWILVVVALAILFAVVWVLRPSRSAGGHVQTAQKTAPATSNVKHGQTMTLPAADANSNAQVQTPNGPVAKQEPASPPARQETSSVSPQHASSASASPPANADNTAPAGRGPVWHVILYAYNREADAARRVATINRRHPDLNAEVFTPNGAGKPPYLVSLGGSTDRNAMEQLRRDALQAGLPRDSYLQNYSR